VGTKADIAEPAGQDILVSNEDAITTITLNRPRRRNAMTYDGWALLRRLLVELAEDEATRVVVIRGAGGSFCAGADLSATADAVHPLDRLRRMGEVALALNEFPKPVIAHVEGAAVGAGCNLAFSCDFVVAAESARFAQVFGERGLSVDFGGSWILPRIVGLPRAKQLVLLAETLGADEARELGLVTWVRPDAEAEECVDTLARRLAAMPPVAMRLSKRLLTAGATNSLHDAIHAESLAQVVNLATADAPAAFRAFAHKRPAPEFTGRWALTAEND